MAKRCIIVTTCQTNGGGQRNGDTDAALFPGRGPGGQHHPGGQLSAPDPAHPLPPDAGSGGGAGPAAAGPQEPPGGPDPRRGAAAQAGGGDRGHGGQDRGRVHRPGGHRQRGRLHRQRRDPRPVPHRQGDPAAAGREPGHPLPPVQRQRSGCHRPAGQGPAGFRHRHRAGGYFQVRRSVPARPGRVGRADAPGQPAGRQGAHRKGRPAGPAPAVLPAGHHPAPRRERLCGLVRGRFRQAGHRGQL